MQKKITPNSNARDTNNTLRHYALASTLITSHRESTATIIVKKCPNAEVTGRHLHPASCPSLYFLCLFNRVTFCSSESERDWSVWNFNLQPIKGDMKTIWEQSFSSVDLRFRKMKSEKSTETWEHTQKPPIPSGLQQERSLNKTSSVQY